MFRPRLHRGGGLTVLTQSGRVSTGMGDHSRVRVSFALSQYLINHPGQLSLAIPPWPVGKI